MARRSLSSLAVLVFIALAAIAVLLTRQPPMNSAPKLLTDPFLQLPTETSVRVVWFTEFPGTEHTVAYGEGLNRTASATTTLLSRTREDHKSHIEDAPVEPTRRKIWRHEAEVTGLTSGIRVSYRVTSRQEDGQAASSEQFDLAPLPPPETPLKILLTSDHQLKPMTTANLQKVGETVGQVDGVFFAGDLVNVADRASEWFDDKRGGAFFPSLQGYATYALEQEGVKTSYSGAPLIQSAPLFTAIGNHDVMGRFSTESSLSAQFSDAIPRSVAKQLYSPPQSQQKEWLKNHSFNTDTYNEMFTLPQSNTGGENYYAVTFGNVRLIVLYATNIWRTPSLESDAMGKYREAEADLPEPKKWGYGQHIFEPLHRGSTQYRWLEAELNSPEFQQAKYKVVMFHHPPHSLGSNVVPPYTDPVQKIDRDAENNTTAVRYEYPQAKDYIIRDVVPLLESAGVQLVFYGHSHLWNRFVSASGMHFLETSNVGNTYGAFVEDKQRQVPTGYEAEYVATGNPNGLEPIVPNLAPLRGEDNHPLPYLASNEITVFSILDTGTGLVSSYYFDTRSPSSEVVKFDEFSCLTN